MAQWIVEEEAPAYVVVANDPVNFELHEQVHPDFP